MVYSCSSLGDSQLEIVRPDFNIGEYTILAEDNES